MKVNFAVYETPKPKNRKGKQLVHARLQPKGTKKMEDVCESIAESTELSYTEVMNVLDEMFQYVSMQLRDGYNVDLDAFGHFSIGLRSKQVLGNDGKYATKISIDGVNFRCSPRLKEKVKKTQLQRVERTTAPNMTQEERERRLVENLKENGTINLREYAQLNSCSRYCAERDIKHFLEKGVITYSGSATHKIYLLADMTATKKPLQPKTPTVHPQDVLLKDEKKTDKREEPKIGSLF